MSLASMGDQMHNNGYGDGNNHQEERRPNMNWLVRFRFRREDDPHNDMRTVLLVVCALIATVTFQAGVNPPGGVWQETDKNSTNTTIHIPGSAIYATHTKPFYVFLVFNTLALSTSIFVIMSLTFMFPFSIEIWIATISMIVTYGSSIFAITPHNHNYKFRYLLITAAFPLVARVAVETCRYLKRSYYPHLSFTDIINNARKWFPYK